MKTVAPPSFRQELGLPEDPRAMPLDALDRLISYHDELCERYDRALARQNEVWGRIERAMREHGTEAVKDLGRTSAAPLLRAFAAAFAESNRCRREIEAIGAYAEPLLREEP